MMKAAMHILINTLAVALTCGVLAWAADVVRRLGFLVYTEQYIAAMVALALPLVYLAVPARKPAGAAGAEVGEGRRRTGGVPWYDSAAAPSAPHRCMWPSGFRICPRRWRRGRGTG
jgi:hypothetical protein